ncbi:MAG: MCE family protein [Ignavibacteriaceae bacterium]|nr:MCE family protein [Ignavibacteriaceae bacterium]
MASKTSILRLGIFIFIGTAFLVTAIFLIGDKDSMFTESYNVKAYFNTIEGLRKGAAVRLSGINVGNVSSISIVDDSTGRVEVLMRLSADVKRFIKSDTRATIETEGLVGNKVIILLISSTNAPPVENFGVIQGVDPLGFGKIVEETQSTIEFTKQMTRDLSEIVARVNRGEGSIGKFLTRDEFYYNANSLLLTTDTSLSSITQKLDTISLVVSSLLLGTQSIVSNVDRVVLEIDNIVHDVEQGKGLLGAFLKDSSNLDKNFGMVLNNIIKITEDTKIGAEKFSENMEALKRNWLFKTYFEQRGFYDKTPYEKVLERFIRDVEDKILILDKKIIELEKLKKLENKQSSSN